MLCKSLFIYVTADTDLWLIEYIRPFNLSQKGTLMNLQINKIILFCLLLTLISCKAIEAIDNGSDNDPDNNPPPSNELPINYRVFVTSITNGPSFGALSNADDICDAQALAANIGGTWTAWLSNDSADAIDRINTTGPWYLVDESTLVASDLTELTSGTLSNAIDMDELGATVSTQKVFTGTNSTGTGTSANCSNWSTGLSTGTYGWADRNNFEWTDNASAGIGCGAQRFYCFEN